MRGSRETGGVVFAARQADRIGSNVGAVPVAAVMRPGAEMRREELLYSPGTLEGNETHGRRGRRFAGNSGHVPRTRQRSNASRSRVVADLQHLCCGGAEAQRRGGNGRSDAKRLQSGGLLRGV